jgi:hypothetical protein
MSTVTERSWAYPDRQTWIRSARLYYLDPSENSVAGWFFKVRGPRHYGPFRSRREADQALQRVISEYRTSNDTGRR